MSPGRGCAGCPHPAPRHPVAGRFNSARVASLPGQSSQRRSCWSRPGRWAADRCSPPWRRCCFSWPVGAWLLGPPDVASIARSPLLCRGSPTWLPLALSLAPRLPMPSTSYDGTSLAHWPTDWHPSSVRFGQASIRSLSTRVTAGTTRCAGWSSGWLAPWRAGHPWPTWWPLLLTINGDAGGGPLRLLPVGLACTPSVRWSSVSYRRSSCSASFRSC